MSERSKTDAPCKTDASCRAPVPDNLHIRKARLDDVKDIHHLLMGWADRHMLLARPLTQLYTHLRDFFVICSVNEQGEETLLGCCALAIFWDDLAEIRSLAVKPETCGQGLGRLLMEAAVEEARELGLSRLFALTYQEAFFVKMGFSVVSKDALPQKVWTDCINCPKFPNCDEIAVQRLL